MSVWQCSASADQLFEMVLKKLDEAYHWKPLLITLTGLEFEWNNCAVHESEEESDDGGLLLNLLKILMLSSVLLPLTQGT